METPKVFESEYRFCLILWEREPVSSGELVKLCGERLGWKPTTTYTVLKALVNHGYCENVDSTVRSLVTREQVEREDSTRIAGYARERFGGSLPKFIATFVSSEGMSRNEAEEIIRMLEDFTKNGEE